MLTRLCPQLEQKILQDPGKRGIQNLFISGELYRSLYLLNRATNHVVLGTGFPVTDFETPTESDGPSGCMILAYSLIKHFPDRKVTIAYDPIHEPVMGKLVDTFNNEFHKIPENSGIDQVLNAFNTKDISKSEEFFALPQFKDIDHMIAVELGGPNKKGLNKTSRNRDITDRCGITPWLFDYAFKNDICATTGIGDGGNETGMGKVIDIVEEKIKNGKDIACAVETQFLITAGVSNWGAEALALGLHLDDIMNTLDVNKRIFCDDKFHELMYKKTGEFGAADPIRKVFDGGCDGMEYSVHKDMWQDLCDTTMKIQEKMFPAVKG